MSLAVSEERQVIPIQQAARQREQATTSYLGLVVFLAAWTMMFGALFFAYGILRLRFPQWPPPGYDPLPLGWPGINTLIIVAASGLLYLGQRGLHGEQAKRFPWFLSAAILLGAAFLALQLHVWVGLWRQGFRLGGGIYPSVFYLLTIFHALHVVVGLALLIALWPAAWRPARLVAAASRLRLATVFWHFVGAVWLVLFVIVYLV